MRPRSIALTRHVRAASMASCLFGLSSALPITERISSISLSISFLASSLSSESRMLYTITRPRCCTLGLLWRHNLCRISSHWEVCRKRAATQSMVSVLLATGSKTKPSAALLKLCHRERIHNVLLILLVLLQLVLENDREPA